jgi:hypothetical protein
MSTSTPPARSSAQQTDDQLAEARAELIDEFNRLVDHVEDAATEPLFDVGDFLVDHVPNEQGRRSDLGAIAPKLTLRELAEQRGFSVRWLREIRQVAETTRGSRLPGVKLTVYRGVLRQNGWDIEAANREIHDREVAGEPVTIPRERPVGEPRVRGNEGGRRDARARHASAQTSDTEYNSAGVEQPPPDDDDGDSPTTLLRRAADAIALQVDATASDLQAIASQVDVIRNVLARLTDDEPEPSGNFDEADEADEPVAAS